MTESTINSAVNPTVNPAVNPIGSAVDNSTTSPLTSRQFLSFETIAATLFSLSIAAGVYVWSNHSNEFRELKSDVKNLNQIIPTLATRAEMNARFDKVDEKFEKMDAKFEKVNDKLNTLILSMNTFQNTMATKAEVNELASKVTANSYELSKHDDQLALIKTGS